MVYLGCFFLWGNISIYVLSYFYQHCRSCSYTFIFMVDSMLIFSNWTGYHIGVYLFQTRRWNAKLVICLGGTLSLSGVYLSSYTTGIRSFLAMYCCMNGIGCGTCYFVVLICAWEWFPTKKGLVTGLTLGGYGFGSFLFSLISTRLVNPEHTNPTIYDAANDVTYYDSSVADRAP